MLPLVRLFSCQHGGMVGHIRRHFKNNFLLWIVGFLREVFKSLSLLEGVIMALKNWAGMDSFPIHGLYQFKYSQAALGPTHRFAHFFLRGFNEG